MSSTLTIGVSASLDPISASAEAVRAALAGASHPVFALVLATDGYDHRALVAALEEELRAVPWGGCCTAGVFTADVILEQGLVVGVISASDGSVGIGVGSAVSVDGAAAGRQAASRALDGLPAPSATRHRAMILLPCALSGKAADVVKGAAAEAGSGIAWAGGGAGDSLQFVRTAQYAHGVAFEDHAVAIAIELSRRFGVGIRHGWRPYGPPTLVTKTRGATVVELEYESAFEIYRRTVGAHGDVVTRENFAAFAMTHPLGIPRANGEHVIRDPLGVDEDGGFRCIASVPDGSVVRVMKGNCDALIAAARDAAETARAGVEGDVAGAFVFDCVSRSLMLGDRMRMEVDAFRAGLGKGVPLMGCLSFGEVGAPSSGVPEFHNKTAVVLALPR